MAVETGAAKAKKKSQPRKSPARKKSTGRTGPTPKKRTASSKARAKKSSKESASVTSADENSTIVGMAAGEAAAVAGQTAAEVADEQLPDFDDEDTAVTPMVVTEEPKAATKTASPPAPIVKIPPLKSGSTDGSRISKLLDSALDDVAKENKRKPKEETTAAKANGTGWKDWKENKPATVSSDVSKKLEMALDDLCEQRPQKGKKGAFNKGGGKPWFNKGYNNGIDSWGAGKGGKPQLPQQRKWWDKDEPPAVPPVAHASGHDDRWVVDRHQSPAPGKGWYNPPPPKERYIGGGPAAYPYEPRSRDVAPYARPPPPAPVYAGYEERYEQPSHTGRGCMVKVSNVPSNIGKKDLERAFVVAGKIESVVECRTNPGSFVVTYFREEDARGAIHRYDGGTLNNKKIVVKLCTY